YNYKPDSNWNNAKNSKGVSQPDFHPPILGLKVLPRKNNVEGPLRNQIIHDDLFRKYIIAANKRMIKNWMGVIKYLFKDATEDRQKKLYDWFQKEEARHHFRGWSQQLGTQTAEHKGAAHTNGQAMDINYEMNPYCPVYSQETRTMVGEKRKDEPAVAAVAKEKSYGEILNTCGRIYDRALRLYVPTVEIKNGILPDTEPEKINNSIIYFAEHYYRSHYDWTQDNSIRDAAPFAADQVYKFYQIMNWSLRFYFDLVYTRVGLERNHDTTMSDLNNFNQPHVARSEEELSSYLNGLLADTSAPTCPTAQFLVEEDVFSAVVTPPDSNPLLFSQRIEGVRYPYQSKSKHIYYRFNLSSLNTYSQEDKAIIVKCIRNQIIEDHQKMSFGMLYGSAASRRDPCNGIFNFSYETFLSLCYLPKDLHRLRAFGSFFSQVAGDMQHFDYGYKQQRGIMNAIISPEEGAIWVVGATPKIEWRIYGASTIDIFYIKQKEEKEIKSNLSVSTTVGFFDWTIPNDCEVDNDAMIKIVAKDDEDKVVGKIKSSHFSISKGMILLPEKDTKCKVGATQIILWTVPSGGVSTVDITCTIQVKNKKAETIEIIKNYIVSSPTVSNYDAWIPEKEASSATLEIVAFDSKNNMIAAIKSYPFSIDPN
ncbi:hypothetical protein JW979_12500, partial [bacterium]|nr:hypothetical protein [candidate division CSSED10-310 bacterium]